MPNQPTFLAIYLIALLALILWASGRKRLAAFFRFTPAVLYAYFLPAIGTALGLTPASSPAYDWMIRFLLPTSLMLLMVTVDVRAILRLGGRALIMMLAGSLGIIVGGPVALLVFGRWLPEDTWMGLAALSGSWIGGTANMVAIKESVGTPDALMGPIIVVDTVVAYTWMGLLLALSAWQERFDRWVGADRGAIEGIDARLAERGEKRRPASQRDLAILLAVGLGGAALAILAGDRLPALGDPTIVSHTTWTVALVTALGLALSFTKLRRIEASGGTELGYLALYLMVTAIGAQADLVAVLQVPLYLVVGFVWLGIHVAVLFTAAVLTRSPLFFVATGSMANVGGAVSAPVVAAVYHRALAPVGVLMGVAGYVVGIYGSLVCAWLLARVGG